MDTYQPSAPRRAGSWLFFVGTAALVAYAIHASLDSPVLVAVVGVAVLAVSVPQLLARRRMRRLMMSGDPDALLAAWEGALEQLPHARTTRPLVAATALASSGLIERARRQLDRAQRGPAWEASIEQRLVVETILDAFEGERASALEKAAELNALPLPDSGRFLRRRMRRLRRGIGALSRAFARRTEQGDASLLKRTAKRHPFLAWPLRYAAAVAFVEGNQPDQAQRMLHDAPSWPEDSVFSAFHDEILGRAQRARS